MHASAIMLRRRCRSRRGDFAGKAIQPGRMFLGRVQFSRSKKPGKKVKAVTLVML